MQDVKTLLSEQRVVSVSAAVVEKPSDSVGFGSGDALRCMCGSAGGYGGCSIAGPAENHF